MRRSRNYILSTNRMMIWPCRRQHSSPPSNSLQPSRRCRFHPSYNLILPKHKLLRTPTNFPNQYQQPSAPHRAPNCSHRQISSIWSSPMTPFSYRRSNSRLCPTSLKHNSCSRDLPNNPIPPTNFKQQYHHNSHVMSRCNHHTIYSNLCSHPK